MSSYPHSTLPDITSIISTEKHISMSHIGYAAESTEIAEDDPTITPNNPSIPKRWMGVRDNEIIKKLIGINGNSDSSKITSDVGQYSSSSSQVNVSTVSLAQKPSNHFGLFGIEKRQVPGDDENHGFMSQATNKRNIDPIVPVSSNYPYGLPSPTDNDTPTYLVNSDTSDEDEVPLSRRMTNEGSSSKNPLISRVLTSHENDDALDDLPLSLSRRSERLKQKVRTTHSVITEIERESYTSWKSPSGKVQPTAGALIPQGYNLHNNPQFPWICPVRSCRMLYAKLCGLGSHFVCAHRGSLFNDNEDGTISLLKRQNGAGSRVPAAVVSRKPLDPNEPPMVEPSLPHYKKLMGSSSTLSKANDSRDEPSGGIRFRISSPYNIYAPNPSRETGDDLWKYIQSHLARTPLSPMPLHGHVPELLKCSYRVRDVEFNFHAEQPFLEKRDQDISAMIVQVTGRKASKACGRCKEGKGPFKGCYIIPTNAPLKLRQSISGCANCYYRNMQTHCNLRKWSLKTYPELSGPRVIESGPPQQTETERLPERRSIRKMLREERRKKKDLVRTDPKQYPPRLPTHNIQPQNTIQEFSIQGGDPFISAIHPAQIIELETWEMAPGHIGDEARETTHNFAFSTAYLTQNQSVRICRDVSLQVITIKPGTVYSWDAYETYLRLCSVASGKLQVKIHGQEFPMGPNGMVVIKPGVECGATNKFYVDAVVHVTVLPSDLYE